MDLEGVCRRGRIGGFRVRKKIWFSGLGGDNLLGFLGSLSSFQPSLGVGHENMGMNFIFQTTDKEFLEEGI
jgi:hypothetical protein